MTNLGLLAATLLVIFGFGECALRVAEWRAAAAQRAGQSWAVYDSELGYRPRPGFADLNSDGLRDDPIDPVKRRFRILMLGDSVAVYADSAQDTYVGRLEAQLATDRSLAPVEVINAGVRGYTNYQELVYLQKYGIAFQPDLVGVGFVLNDLHRILHRFEVENGEIVGQEYAFADEAIGTVESPLYRLARKSHLLVELRGRLGVFDRLIDLYASKGFAFDYRPDFSNAWRDEPWSAVEQQLATMVELGAERGFRVFLVAFPFGEQLRPDHLARDRAYVTRPQQRLGEIAARLGIPCLDLFSALDRERDLDPDQIHLTRHGRGVAADAIARFLKERGLVPARRDLS